MDEQTDRQTDRDRQRQMNRDRQKDGQTDRQKIHSMETVGCSSDVEEPLTN